VRLGGTLLNLEQGGQRKDGSFDPGPGADAIASDPTYCDLVVMCEGRNYALYGQERLNAMSNELARRTGRPIAERLGVLDRDSELGPVLFYDASVVRVDRSFGYGVPMVSQNRANVFEMHVAATGTPFVVVAQHWDYQSGRRRLAEAERVSRVAGFTDPVFVMGDLNSTASGRHETSRDFRRVPASHRFHKGRWPAGRWGRVRADTDALDYLLGRWSCWRRRRVGGVGMYDLAELAAFNYGEPHALTPTTNTPPERGGPVRIDRVLTNEAGRERLVPGSFRVEIPHAGREPSDHRVVRFAIDLPGLPDCDGCRRRVRQ
jgi:endonuclease/exonuclease/phosphatase family metal-dependent hydrolase